MANYVEVPLAQGFSALTDLFNLGKGGLIVKQPRTATLLGGTCACAFGGALLSDSPSGPPVIGSKVPSITRKQHDDAVMQCDFLLTHAASIDGTGPVVETANGPQPVGSWLSVFIDMLIAQIKKWLGVAVVTP